MSSSQDKFNRALDSARRRWMHTDAITIAIDTTPDLAPKILCKWEGQHYETNNLDEALDTLAGWLDVKSTEVDAERSKP